jgi:hypothetical protein
MPAVVGCWEENSLILAKKTSSLLNSDKENREFMLLEKFSGKENEDNLFEKGAKLRVYR